MELRKKYRTILAEAEIRGTLRLANFFGQLHHESALKPVSENLNYSQGALLRVFKKYFSVGNINQYARKPEKIANLVYANRMGNGDEASGDGWKYRGRGFIQLTGKDNYRMLSDATGVDYVDNPDLLLNEADAMMATIWFWQVNRLNELADNDNIGLITKRINGGLNGLEDRKKWVRYYKGIFKNEE